MFKRHSGFSRTFTLSRARSLAGHSTRVELQQRRPHAGTDGCRSPGHHLHHLDTEQDPDGRLGPAHLDAPRLSGGPRHRASVGASAQGRHHRHGLPCTQPARHRLLRRRSAHLVHQHPRGAMACLVGVCIVGVSGEHVCVRACVSACVFL